MYPAITSALFQRISRLIGFFRGGVFFAGICLLISLSACHAPIIIPEMPNAQEQYRIANDQYQIFCSPLLAMHQSERREHARKTLAAFDMVLQRFPEEKNLGARSELAVADVYKRLGQTRKALEKFSQIMLKYPTNEQMVLFCLVESGDLNDDLEKHQEAKGFYQEAITRFGNSQDPETQKIILYCRGRYNKVWGPDSLKILRKEKK